MKKSFNKIICLVAAFAMIFNFTIPNIANAAETGKPEIKVTSNKENVVRGEEFELTVNLNTNSVPDIATVDLSLKFDSNVLEAVGDPVPVMPTNGGVDTVGIAGGTLSKYGYSISGTATTGLNYNGVLYTQKFKVKEDAAFGNTAFEFDFSNAAPISNMSYSAIDTTITTTSVNVINPLNSISLNKESGELNVDSTDTLNVIYDPDDTTEDKTVVWTTSDANKATVNNGVVTAKAPGSVKITATVGTGENAKTATCNYVIKSPLKGISLCDDFEILKGQTKKLDITLNPTNTTDKVETAVWTSSDENCVTVDENGNIKALKETERPVTISVRVNDSFDASVDVTVNEIPLNTVAIGELKHTMLKGEAIQLTAILNPENTTDDKTATWTSSNPDVAEIDSDGNLYALKEGRTDITVTVAGKPATETITVIENHLESIDLSSNQTKLEAGKDYTIDVKLNPEDCTDNMEFFWQSSDEDVVKLADDGTYTALKEGKATITVKAVTEYGKEVFATMDVEVVSEKVPASEETKSTSPQTGDLPIGIIAMVSGLSLIGAIVVARKKLVNEK